MKDLSEAASITTFVYSSAYLILQIVSCFKPSAENEKIRKPIPP